MPGNLYGDGFRDTCPVRLLGIGSHPSVLFDAGLVPQGDPTVRGDSQSGVLPSLFDYARGLVLLSAITVTYRRSPGPPLGRLTPRRCRLALTPGRSAQRANLRAGDGLAGYPSPGWVWRGGSGRPGGPGFVRPTYTSSYLCPRVLSNACKQQIGGRRNYCGRQRGGNPEIAARQPGL